MNSTRRKQIVSSLKDKEYRDLFVSNEISVGLPFQIRALREKRNWTQGELADKTGKAQGVISQLEDPNYGRFTLATLKRLASAFDVALIVRFVPFSELVGRAVNLDSTDLAVPSFHEDENLVWDATSVFNTGDGVTASTEQPKQPTSITKDQSESREIISPRLIPPEFAKTTISGYDYRYNA